MSAPAGFIRIPNPIRTTGARQGYYPSLDADIPVKLRDALRRAFDDLYSLQASISAGAGPFALTGAIDGANMNFTLSKSPPGAVLLFLNGVLLRQLGSSPQVKINGTAVTVTPAPLSGDWLAAYFL